MQPLALPPEFTGVSFTTTDAITGGVPPNRLRAADLTAPFHGLRAPAGAAIDAIEARCLQLLPHLAGPQFFSHRTAGELWEIPLPAFARSGPLHVSAIPPAREPRMRGVIGHRMSVDFEELTFVKGLPVPTPRETWAQLGATLRLDGLIIAADDLLTRGLVTADDLATAASRFKRRGKVALTMAAEEARSGSESPRETETRLVLLRAGLPEPLLNWTLRTGTAGFVARLDLAYPDYRVCVEYDGRQHADLEQFARDADRWAAIEAEGWILVRVLSHHFDDPARFIVGRTRAALRARGWR